MRTISKISIAAVYIFIIVFAVFSIVYGVMYNVIHEDEYLPQLSAGAESVDVGINDEIIEDIDENETEPPSPRFQASSKQAVPVSSTYDGNDDGEEDDMVTKEKVTQT